MQQSSFVLKQLRHLQWLKCLNCVSWMTLLLDFHHISITKYISNLLDSTTNMNDFIWSYCLFALRCVMIRITLTKNRIKLKKIRDCLDFLFSTLVDTDDWINLLLDTSLKGALFYIKAYLKSLDNNSIPVLILHDIW